jgi:pilus assembly protein Flp/PilA
MAGVRAKWLCWRGFIRDEAGSAAVEYGLLAGLIGVAVIGGLSAVGSSLNTSFQNTATSISSSPPAQTGGTGASGDTGASSNGSGNNGTTGTGSNGSETANGSNNSGSGGGTTGTNSNGTETADSSNAGTGSNDSGNSTTPTTPPTPPVSNPPADPVVECLKDNKGKGAGSDKKCEA